MRARTPDRLLAAGRAAPLRRRTRRGCRRRLRAPRFATLAPLFLALLLRRSLDEVNDEASGHGERAEQNDQDFRRAPDRGNRVVHQLFRIDALEPRTDRRYDQIEQSQALDDGGRGVEAGSNFFACVGHGLFSHCIYCLHLLLAPNCLHILLAPTANLRPTVASEDNLKNEECNRVGIAALCVLICLREKNLWTLRCMDSRSPRTARRRLLTSAST